MNNQLKRIGSFFLNPFIVLGDILFLDFLLYQLHWFDLLDPLEYGLTIFLLFSIGLMFLAGAFLNRYCIFYLMPGEPKHLRLFMIILLGLLALQLAISGSALSEILHGGEYKSTANVPIIGTMDIVLGTCYSIYLFYAFLCFHKPKYMVCSLILQLIPVLAFSRMQLLIYIGVCIILFVAYYQSFDHKMSKAKIAAIVLVIIVCVLFFFGVAGNIRSGKIWNDSDFIDAVGYFNSSWPVWLPSEFKWAYLYFVDPLANLNANVHIANHVFAPMQYISYLLPANLGPFLQSSTAIEPFLPREILTTCTAYIYPYIYGDGFLGLYIFNLFIIVIDCLLIKFTKGFYRTIILAYLSLGSVFMVFDDPFYISGYSLCLLFMFVCFFIDYSVKSRRRFGRHYGVLDHQDLTGSL